MDNALVGLLGAVRDPQFRQDVGRGLLDAANRGGVAGLLGGPVDLATMALRPFGYSVEKPVGGSEWIGQKMQNAGLVSGNRNALAEALASVAVPAAAPTIGRGLFAAEQALAPKAAELARRTVENTMVRNGLLQRMVDNPLQDNPAHMAPHQGQKLGADYQISHRPMTVDQGAALLHDLEPAFGRDIYGPNALQYFGSGDARERAILRQLNAVRGKPDAMVTIYRGVPDGVNAINAGDWVTLDPRVAADYGRVVSKQVPAAHITGWADSLMEFGYWPK